MLKRCIFVIGWLWLGVQTAVAQTPPPSLETYWQLMAELQQAVTQLEGEPVATQEQELAAWARRLETVTAVTLPSGEPLPIQHTFLIRQLQNSPPDLPYLKNLLANQIATNTAWSIKQFSQSDTESLREIFTDPAFDYRAEQPSTLEMLIEKARQRFLEFLSRLFPDINSPLGQVTDRLLTFLGAIALVVVLVYALRGILSDLTSQATLTAEVESGENLTADFALQRAQQLSQAGDYRTAVRYLYLSALLRLEERGLLRYNRYLTNREYLRSIADKPELSAILREVIEVFDRVWYGFESLDEQAYQHYAAQVTALKEQQP